MVKNAIIITIADQDQKIPDFKHKDKTPKILEETMLAKTDQK